MDIRNILKAVYSLIFMVSLTLLIGASIGWSNNPDQSDAFTFAAQQMAESGFSGTREEVDARFLEYAEMDQRYNSDAPSTSIAIMKSNTFLLGIFGLLGLLLFRPSSRPVLLLFVSAGGIATVGINPLAGISIFISAIIFLVMSLVFSQFIKGSKT